MVDRVNRKSRRPGRMLVLAAVTPVLAFGLAAPAFAGPSPVLRGTAGSYAMLGGAGISGGVPNTRVLLTNGAQACNVFWQVGTSATIDTYTQFVGNIMAGQSTTLNTGATLDSGRALALNGTVTLDTNTIRQATLPPRPPPAAGRRPAAARPRPRRRQASPRRRSPRRCAPRPRPRRPPERQRSAVRAAP